MNAPLTRSDMLKAGAFTTDQVGDLVGVGAREVASWLKGKHPLISPDYDPVGGRLALSFDALIEARAIGYLLQSGVPRNKVRELVKELRAKLRDRHPLARDRNLITDGARVFESDNGALVNLLNDCYAAPELLRPALHGRVEFRGGRAAWLEPFPIELPLVRIDPLRAFGRPIVVDETWLFPPRRWPTQPLKRVFPRLLSGLSFRKTR